MVVKTRSKMRKTYEYPRPAVAADIAVFTLIDGRLHVLLIKRGQEPDKGMWALPGGFLHDDETLDQCAARELEEETRLACGYLQQFGIYSEPKRDKRWVISVAYVALVPWDSYSDFDVVGSSDADEADWFDLERCPKLAFDHKQILKDARAALSEYIRDELLPVGLLPDSFTLGQLKVVHDAVGGEKTDLPNFRRQMVESGLIERTGETVTTGAHRPAALYRMIRR
jgi:8-oxo-dGTP diphosphatase